MTAKNRDDSAWGETSWKGHRLAQHREFLRLSFADKLKAVEEMGDFAREISRDRQRKGLPYIDPETGKPVSGTHPEKVREDPEPYPESRKKNPPDNS